MHYIIFDLEWNQGAERLPDRPCFEIIEIGAVKLDEHLQMVDRYQSLVKPQIYTTMHRITAELVNLEMEDLRDGRDFPTVCSEFLQWCGTDCVFGIWGSQDLTEFQKNMDYYHMPKLSDGPLEYYDIQKLYSLAREDGRARSALSKVVEEELLLEEAVSFHRAFGDAYYTARILQRIADEALLDRISFDTYCIPKDKKSQVFRKFSDYTKYISRGFAERAELMEDKNITGVRCIYCDKAVRKRGGWYTPNNGKHYYAVAKCPEHGNMKGKIRVRKDKEELYYAVKTVKHVSEEEAEDILTMKQRKRGQL